MFHVLRHYLPIRKAILMGSETVLLTLVVASGMMGHLFGVSERVARVLAEESLSIPAARWRCLISALLVSVFAQVAIAFNELYDIRVSGSHPDRARRFIGSAGVAIVLALGAVALAHVWELDRVLDFPGLPLSQTAFVLTFSLGIGFVLLYFWRALYHFLLHRFSFDERVLIVGDGRVARTLAAELRLRPAAGYEVVGILSDLPAADSSSAATAGERSGATVRARAANWGGGAELRGAVESGERRATDRASRDVTLLLESDLVDLDVDEELPPGEKVEESLPEIVERLRVDDLVVVLEERRGGLPVDDLLRCRLRGVVVEEGESIYERVTGKIAVESMRPSYLIFNQGFVQTPLAAFGKRLTDIALALLIFALTWPLMILTALAVRLDSPGPVLFRQERLGRHGRPFTLCKFRSMRADAEKQSGPVWAQQNDPRITRVGRFLRKTRLDELPQLLNVLSGEMSLVGPRPEREHFVRDLAEQIPYFEQRHLVKPGLTGWAQINYPYGNTVEDARQKLMYDLFYVKNQSTLFDLSILFNTIKTVVLRRGT